ncbi:YbeD family protein [Iodobacter fluviatilis]|uniref:Lipoic acid-binding regulatory protein n=1 Tax=Iodobacter fluviatilis TaxID=537 RepID=A0A377SYU7_9NEIS|nr:DUF493 domain-containing protein [Iodobacter fluviatilis]TCU88188.1 putative lipoic acid-binding regulatory protein [Iodobacter fluviatilis]STR45689.1 Uncharacterized conserved protein [Iodobacter fluviatilis]
MSQDAPNLADLVEFPAELPMKAISHKDVPHDEFHAVVYELAVLHITDFKEEWISVRTSSGGSFISVTLSATYQSADEVNALDTALRAHPLVKMVM